MHDVRVKGWRTAGKHGLTRAALLLSTLLAAANTPPACLTWSAVCLRVCWAPAVVVKLLLHCGMCCLITMMVALGDAAIVAGLHVGARLPLSVSFAVAVAANMVLVLVLLGLLLVARMLNAANNDRLAEMANRPEVRHGLCWQWGVAGVGLVAATQSERPSGGAFEQLLRGRQGERACPLCSVLPPPLALATTAAQANTGPCTPNPAQ